MHYFKKTKLFQSLFLTLLFCITTPAHAQSFPNFEAFKAYIQEYVLNNLKNQSHDQVEIKLMRLDNNMRLPVCAGTFDPKLDHSAATETNNTVTLSCSTNPEWVLYVPVQIIYRKTVVVTARSIKPTETITENDLELQERNSHQLNEGYYENMEEVAGSVSARFIPAGTVLGPKNIKQMPLVFRGQMITVVLKQGPIEITLHAQAKSDGFLHDNIKVMNPSSKKIIDAVVVGSGKAEVL